MAADSTTLQLQQALPQLGPLAIPIVGAIVAVGAVVATRDLLDRFFRQKGETQKATYLTIETQLTSAINDPKALPGLREDGWSTSFLTGQVAEAVAAQIKILDTPTYLPSFATTQTAMDFWSENYNYYLQGLQTDNYFNAITAWVNAEITRLAMAPSVPVVTPTPGPVTVVTPKWAVGQILQTPDGLTWQIKAVDIVDNAPFYTCSRSDITTDIRVPEGVFLSAGAVALTAAPTTGVIPTTTVAIPGFGTAQISVTVQGQSITGVIPTPAVTQPTTQTIVVSSPDIAIGPTTVYVDSPPAPNVTVDNVVDTSSIANMLGLLPMLGVQALSGISALSFNNMGEGMRHGARKCDITTMLGFAKNLAMGLTLPTVGFALLEANPWKDKLDPIISNLVKPLLLPTMLSSEVTPDNVWIQASARLVQAARFGVSAHYLALAGELVNPEKNMGMGFLAGMLADFADFKRTATATIGTIETVTLATPMRQWANREYRPNIPDVGRALSLYAQRELPWEGHGTELGAHDVISLQGFSNHWANIYQDEAYRHPTIRELLRNVSYLRLDMVPGFATPPSDVADYLTAAGYPPSSAYPIVWPYHLAILKSGYHPAYVSWLTELTQRAAARGEKTAMIGTAQKMRRDGFITSARMTEMVLDAWQLTDPVSARVEVAELESDYKVLSDTRAVLVLSMAKGLITREEARDQLTSLGMSSDRVELEVLKGTLGMIPGIKLEITSPEAVLEEAGLEAA